AYVIARAPGEWTRRDGAAGLAHIAHGLVGGEPARDRGVVGPDVGEIGERGRRPHDRPPKGADLTFLHHLPSSFRYVKSISDICLLVPVCFRSSRRRLPRCIANFGGGALAPPMVRVPLFEEFVDVERHARFRLNHTRALVDLDTQ